jgi:hypothetical protein
MTSSFQRSELNAIDPSPALEEVQEAEGPPARRQIGQRFEVHFADESFEVTVANPDRIAFERVQSSRKWPPAKEAQSLAMTFVTWNAAKRAGSTTLTYEQWEATLLDWDLIEDAPADPTR